MMTVADFLVCGLGLELPPELDTGCAITGEHITEGIPWGRVIPSSTGEYLDLLHGMALPYMSLSAAAAFKGSWNMGSRLIFEDGTHYHPLISAESAATDGGRPCWSDLVHQVWPARQGQRCVCIVTDDFKKKIWPRATVGALGGNTPVYLLDAKRHVSRNLSVNWPTLIATLDFVEKVYVAGFNKRAITDGLLSDYKSFSADPRTAMDFEQRLTALRPTPEFAVSVLIAQKKEE
jgi:hypothetical protein